MPKMPKPKSIPKAKIISRFKTDAHNHRGCVDKAISAAKKLCLKRGARLTDARRRVLELVWSNHKPVLAYELMDQISRNGRKAAPPTVYRALDFLLENGLIHRIESLNAFVGCGAPALEHSGQFLICDGCKTIAELDDPEINTLIQQRALKAGFKASKQIIEIAGRCSSCAHLLR